MTAEVNKNRNKNRLTKLGVNRKSNLEFGQTSKPSNELKRHSINDSNKNTASDVLKQVSQLPMFLNKKNNDDTNNKTAGLPKEYNKQIKEIDEQISSLKYMIVICSMFKDWPLKMTASRKKEFKKDIANMFKIGVDMLDLLFDSMLSNKKDISLDEIINMENLSAIEKMKKFITADDLAEADKCIAYNITNFAGFFKSGINNLINNLLKDNNNKRKNR